MITGQFNENFRKVSDLHNGERIPDDTLEEIAAREALQEEDEEE
jgi:hypothetical protein